MTTLQRMQQSDATASESVLEVLSDGSALSPDEVIAAVRRQNPSLSFDSVRRATWNLINEHLVSLTDDYRVQVSR